MTRPEIIERRSSLPFPAESVYAWHERPGAFERLVPPWQRVEVVDRTGGLAEGSLVRLRVHLGPVALSWVARHRDVVPGRQFVDEQVSGPFASWTHHHEFAPDGAGRCIMTDRIEYRVPCGGLGRGLAGSQVRDQIERLLAHRHALLADDLSRHQTVPVPMRVAITGASGLVGQAVAAFLSTGGHQVIRLVRRSPGQGEIHWDPQGGTIDAAGLEGVDAVVHLAGENIAGGRWTRERKQRIVDSRLAGTRLLAEALARLARRPSVLVSASAVGIYGNRGDEVLTETASPGAGFLAELGQAWEEATAPAAAAGIRVALPRLGIVLTPQGGALRQMLLPFRLGLGGPLGSGRQWMPWLTLDDAVGIIHFLLTTASLAGPVNAVAPAPVTNAEFARALGQALRRPAMLPVPGFALEALFGELAGEALLAGQRVEPAVLAARGYRFRDAALLPALKRLLGTD